MASITLELPDEVYNELVDSANHLKISPVHFLELGLSYFMQSDALLTALEGISRIDDNETLVDFPELKEELELDVKFHPIAMEELESLSEEEQVDVLEEVITRISSEDDELLETMDLVIREDGEDQVILSDFSFGQVLYRIGNHIAIYHLALLEEEEEEEEELEGEEEEA